MAKCPCRTICLFFWYKGSQRSFQQHFSTNSTRSISAQGIITIWIVCFQKRQDRLADFFGLVFGFKDLNRYIRLHGFVCIVQLRQVIQRNWPFFRATPWQNSIRTFTGWTPKLQDAIDAKIPRNCILHILVSFSLHTVERFFLQLVKNKKVRQIRTFANECGIFMCICHGLLKFFDTSRKCLHLKCKSMFFWIFLKVTQHWCLRLHFSVQRKCP